MADDPTCQECGRRIETVDDLEKREVPTVQEDGSGGVSFFENNDLFLCEGCKNPLRVGGSD